MAALIEAVCLQTGVRGRAAWIDDYGSALGPMLIVAHPGPSFAGLPSPLLPSQLRYAYELPGWHLAERGPRPFASGVER